MENTMPIDKLVSSLSTLTGNNFTFGEWATDTLNSIATHSSAEFVLFITPDLEVYSNISQKWSYFFQILTDRGVHTLATHVKNQSQSQLNDIKSPEILQIFAGNQHSFIPESIYTLTLDYEDKTIGYLVFLDNKKPLEESLNLIQSAAGLYSVIFSTASAIQNNNYKLEHYKKLLNFNKDINSNVYIMTLLDDIMTSAKEILNAQASSLLLIDKKTNELYFNTISNREDKALQEIRLPIGVGIAGIVAKTGEPILVKDAKNDPRVFKKVDKATTINTKNLLCVPMKVNQEIIGVLEVINSLDKPFFTQEDIPIFRSIADIAAIAINNRTLIDNLKTTNLQLEQKLRELSTINAISQYISKNFDYNIENIFKESINIINSSLHIDRISIFIYDENIKALKIVDSTSIKKEFFPDLNIPLSNKIMGDVFKKGTTLLVKDITAKPKLGRYKKLRYKTKSFVTSPIKVKDTVIGVINFSDKTDGTAFSPEDVQILETIAFHLSEAYENAQFYKQILEKQRIEKELEIAYRIQKSILPTSFPLPELFDISALSIPALEVGGDFYNFIQVDDNKLAVYIADVSGKGIPAALFMALARSIMNIQSRSLMRPSSVLEQSNKFILSDSRDGTFVTLFYLLIDGQNRVLHYGNAGHNPQFYYNSETEELEELNAKGIPLGIMPSPIYDEKKIEIQKGDFVILFTDGVIEANNEIKEEYGTEKLKSVILAHINDSADDMLSAIKKDVSAFYKKVKQFDDLTLSVIKFL